MSAITIASNVANISIWAPMCSGLDHHSGAGPSFLAPLSGQNVVTRSVRSMCRRTVSFQHQNSIASRTRCQAVSKDSTPSPSKTEAPRKSLLCQNCDGNGAVPCGQCKGTGINQEDKFDGRFKAGQTCWLCRGKRQMLCGDCNGAGFMGGFMSSQSD